MDNLRMLPTLVAALGFLGVYLTFPLSGASLATMLHLSFENTRLMLSASAAMPSYLIGRMFLATIQPERFEYLVDESA
jgi:hypothetical protein